MRYIIFLFILCLLSFNTQEDCGYHYSEEGSLRIDDNIYPIWKVGFMSNNSRRKIFWTMYATDKDTTITLMDHNGLELFKIIKPIAQ